MFFEIDLADLQSDVLLVDQELFLKVSFSKINFIIEYLIYNKRYMTA